MAHLAKMLALAATSCSHEQPEPQAVTLPTPPSTASASSTPSASPTVVKRPPPPPYDPDDTTTGVLRHPMHGSDPVGPPPQQYCARVAPSVSATATMQHGGGYDVEVHVTVPASSGATFTPSSNAAQAVQAYGAIVVSGSMTATQAVVRGRLNMIADKANVRIFLPLVCPPGSGSLEVTLFYDRTAGTVKVERIEGH
jgi:hypothetical protein